MPYHIIAWTEDIDNTANTDIQPVTDNFFVISNNHFLPEESWDLRWFWNGSTTLLRSRLFQPSIGFNGAVRPYLRPLDQALNPPDRPAVAKWPESPLRLTGQEEIILEATSGIACGTEQYFAVAGIMQGFQPTPQGEIVSLRGTSVTTPTADAWTTLAMTWESNLPSGRYAVVGCQLIGGDAIAVRVNFQGHKARPGALATTAVGNETDEIFRHGRLGNWGEFNSFIMPQIEELADAATAPTEVFLDLVKVA